jgi:hypothetical protein
MYTQRERERERLIDAKEFAHMIVETWAVQNLCRKSAIFRPREELQLEYKGCVLTELLHVYFFWPNKSITWSNTKTKDREKYILPI